jgi:DNA repair protein RecO (recombination protein O)
VALATSASIILQGFPYGDTSRILRLLTREYGLRSVIAKGALRPRSRYGGILEPFTEGEARFYLKDDRDLHTLGGFELTRSRQALGRHFQAFVAASLLAELALRFGTEEPHPQLFEVLSAGLDALLDPDADRRDVAAVGSPWLMVSLLGYMPEMATCVRCGHSLEAEEPCRLDAESGGVVCLECRPSGRVLDPQVRAEVAAILERSPPARLEKPATHRALLGSYLSRQIVPQAPLRSLDLYLDPA